MRCYFIYSGKGGFLHGVNCKQSHAKKTKSYIFKVNLNLWCQETFERTNPLYNTSTYCIFETKCPGLRIFSCSGKLDKMKNYAILCVVFFSVFSCDKRVLLLDCTQRVSAPSSSSPVSLATAAILSAFALVQISFLRSRHIDLKSWSGNGDTNFRTFRSTEIS